MKKLQNICFLLLVGFSASPFAFASEITLNFQNSFRWVKDIYEGLFSFFNDYFEAKYI